MGHPEIPLVVLVQVVATSLVTGAQAASGHYRETGTVSTGATRAPRPYRSAGRKERLEDSEKPLGVKVAAIDVVPPAPELCRSDSVSESLLCSANRYLSPRKATLRILGRQPRRSASGTSTAAAPIWPRSYTERVSMDNVLALRSRGLDTTSRKMSWSLVAASKLSKARRSLACCR